MDNEYFHELVNVGATSINLKGHPLTDTQFDELLYVLSHSPLESLYLWDSRLACKRVEKLAEVLFYNSSLQILSIWDIIGDDDLDRLAQALHHNSSLQYLDLWDNRIGDVGVEKLAEALHHNSSLRRLDLRDNRIGNEGVEKLVEALYYNISLQSLNLNGNMIGEKGVQKLKEALEKNPFITITIGKIEIDSLCGEEGRDSRMQQYLRLKSAKSSRKLS